MDQIRLSTTEAALYITIFNIILGILLGSIPLILGFVKKERSYAVFGFFGSAIGGALLGLFLSLPIAIVFVWLILRKPKNIITPLDNSSDLVQAEDSEKN